MFRQVAGLMEEIVVEWKNYDITLEKRLEVSYDVCFLLVMKGTVVTELCFFLHTIRFCAIPDIVLVNIYSFTGCILFFSTQKIAQIDRLLPENMRGLRARLYHVLFMPTTIMSSTLQQQQVTV